MNSKLSIPFVRFLKSLIKEPADFKLHLKKYFFEKDSLLITKKHFFLSRPLTSQNVWEKLCKFYMLLSRPPRILEYGSGISTFYHLENLKKIGRGELVSIEHDFKWYLKLRNSFQVIYSSEFSDYTEMVKNTQNKINWSFSINDKKLIFQYFYRQNQGRTGCGTFEEFKDYVIAPSGKFDVIIIDGRARKACVQHVLKSQLLAEDGLLVLFEAGRGHSIWPKKDQMHGTYNYQSEVNALVSLGAELIDGTGYENWENWKRNRPKHKYFSEFCPMETCFWYKGTNKEKFQNHLHG